MKKKAPGRSRRRFLQTAAASSCLTAVSASGAATSKAPAGVCIYAELGVRTVINGRGVAATFYSGTLMPSEVHRAMERASEHFVEIVELQKAVGARLAKFAGMESAMVCSSSAACISQATAGCIAGTDSEKIGRLPDTAGMKNEVIITHRNMWDRSIALVGAKLVVAENADQLRKRH